MFKRLLRHLGWNAAPLSNKRRRWDEIQKNTIELSDLSRSLTAREAYEKVELRVRVYDQAARLTAITSGEDISSPGYSDRWELVFVLPEGWAQIIFSFTSFPQASTSI